MAKTDLGYAVLQMRYRPGRTFSGFIHDNGLRTGLLMSLAKREQPP
jgi:hypothetical protein